MSPESGSWQGTLGLIRAHERASIDQFLAHAGAERGRLETLVEQAEMRYVEAGAAYEAAIAEYDRIADELGAAWLEIQAEREHAALTVQERLHEVRSGTRFPLPPPLAQSMTATARAPVQPAPSVAASWQTPPTASRVPDEDDDHLARWEADESTGLGEAGSTGGVHVATPTPAFAFSSHPTEHLTPTEVLNAVPSGPAPIPSVSPPQPGDPVAPTQHHSDFWQLEEAAATLRAGQLEGTLTALLPMVALVIVLVVVLAWIG